VVPILSMVSTLLSKSNKIILPRRLKSL
jgi:hypothetical protein